MAQKYDNSVQYVDRIVSILLKKKLDKICAQDEVPVSRLAMASISLRLGASRQKARCGYSSSLKLVVCSVLGMSWAMNLRAFRAKTDSK